MMTKFARFIFLLSLVGGCGSFAQITLDTHNNQDNGSNAQSSAVVQLKNVSAGDLITCEVTMDSSATFSSVSDTLNGTYVAGCPVHTNTVITQQAGIYYFPNAAAGTYNVTLAVSSSHAWNAISCQAWKGAASSSPLDTTIGASGCLQQDQTNTANPTAGTAVAPSQSGELVIASALMGGSTIAITAGASYTMTDPDTTTLLFPEYWVQPTSTATNGPYTAPSDTWTDQMVAFKPATAFSPCDLNADGAVNILDVQFAIDMDLSEATCTAPGGYCNPVFVQNIMNTALGQPCTLTVLGVPSAPVNVGNVIVGNSAVQSATLTATGSGTTTVSQVTVTPATFTISGLTLPLTLSAGTGAPFNVTFTPASAGSATGNIAIATASASDALNSPLSVPLSGYGVNSHTVSLSWTPSTSGNVASYNVYRITSSSSTAPAAPYPGLVSGLVATSTCSANICAYTDSTVLAGTSYWYYATAVSGGVESAPSNAAQAVVPIP